MMNSSKSIFSNNWYTIYSITKNSPMIIRGPATGSEEKIVDEILPRWPRHTPLSSVPATYPPSSLPSTSNALHWDILFVDENVRFRFGQIYNCQNWNLTYSVCSQIRSHFWRWIVAYLAILCHLYIGSCPAVISWFWSKYHQYIRYRY